MPNRTDILAEAKTWLGTPFKHQGRVKGRGVDCVGIVIGIAHHFNLTDFDYVEYSHLPDGVTMRKLLDENLQPILIDQAQPGDVYLMRFEYQPQHVSIVTEYGMIHAYAQVRRCVEHRIDDIWRSRIVAAYAFKGIDE
jgi:NlpC/P60 family putative phage cell wall peptidase